MRSLTVDTSSSRFIISMLLYFIPLLASVAYARYPIQITDDEIKYSPRILGRSTVVYKNAMYVYGGQYGPEEMLTSTNKMYKYTFDTENDLVSMTLVNQANEGPNCTYCGAVMINGHQMMILTQAYANEGTANPLTKSVVRPYIFDFTTNTWDLNISTPSYPLQNESVFRMRSRHNTVIHDNVIYTLGGTDFYSSFDTTALNTSWYYDIKSHSYGIVNNNGFSYRSIQGCSFNLPNDTIGSIYGKISDMAYNSDEKMMILDTRSKSWTEKRKLINGKGGPGIEGATVQTSYQRDGTPNFAYFFGGYTEDDYEINYSFTQIYILNLQNNTWLNVDTLHKEKDEIYAVPRSYASSALLLNKYFVIYSGKIEASTTTVLSDLDIVRLPAFKSENSFKENESGYVEVVYVPSISKSDFNANNPSGLALAARFFILLFCAFTIILLSTCILVRMSRPRDEERGICCGFGLPHFLWHRRAGESYTTQVSRLVTRIFLFAIFVGFLYYFVFNVINSSVSSTTEYKEISNIVFPDIRFCYTGWTYMSDTPKLGCYNRDAPALDAGCSEFDILDSDIFAPAFENNDGENVFCDMYISNITGGSFVPRSISKLSFIKRGVFTNERQRLHLQFYEPQKNPNRVVYLNETIEGLDANAIDRWMDSEMVSGSTSDTLDQGVILHVDSNVHILFKTITTKQIDPTSLWNYVGIYPKYNIKTDLSITHTESTDSGSDNLMEENATYVRLPGEINVSPADFFDTIVTEQRDTTIVSVLGVLGGVFGILFFIEAFLFGTKPNSPWGLIQNARFISTSREGSKRNLSKYFLLPKYKDLPLKTPVHPRFSDIFNMHNQLRGGTDEHRPSASNQGSTDEIAPLGLNYCLEQSEKAAASQNTLLDMDRNVADRINLLLERMDKLEARNQILELVLKTYYIDDRVFNELQDIVDERELFEEQGDSFSKATKKRSVSSFF